MKINIFPSEIHNFFVIRKTKKIFWDFWWIFHFFLWKSLIFDEFSPSIYFRGIFLEFLVIFFGWFLWQNKMKNVTKNRWKYRKKARIEARRGEVWKTAKLTLSRKLPVWLEGWPKINCLDYQKNCCFNICWFCWISYRVPLE